MINFIDIAVMVVVDTGHSLYHLPVQTGHALPLPPPRQRIAPYRQGTPCLCQITQTTTHCTTWAGAYDMTFYYIKEAGRALPLRNQRNHQYISNILALIKMKPLKK